MTMTITETTDLGADEKTMIGAEVETLTQIERLRERVAESRKARRSIPRPTEALEAAQRAYDDARATVQATRVALAEQEATLARQTTQQKAGDRSVTAASIRATKDEIETLTNYLDHDEKELQKAERALKPLQADDHLAYLAADALESISDVPVVVYKSVTDAPDIEPLVIVSQTLATENYGTLDANGEVRLTLQGAQVNLKALKEALEQTGSEVSVSANSIIFDRASWPLPRLHRPSRHALGELMSTFAQAFHAQAMGGSDAQRLVDAGYNPQRIQTAWSGLFKRMEETLEVAAPGEVVGEATFACALQHERGDSAGLDAIKGDLEALVRTFQHEAVGGWSEAGEIASIELAEVDVFQRHEVPWSDKQVARLHGEPCWPYTAEAKLRVTYSYQEA